MILIFGGTTEGKKAMQLLNGLALPYMYSTKTEIDSSEIQGGYRFGELDKEGIIKLVQEEKVTQIIDVAHPFAEVLHRTISEASLHCDIPVFRVEREYPERKNHSLVIYCKGYEEVLQRLENQQNKTLLALSGVQSIPKLEQYWRSNKTFFRVLYRKWSIDFAVNHDFSEEQLILGLPNKNIETEIDLYKEKNIGVVLTKESGESGSLSVKIEACLALDIPILIIEKPILPESICCLDNWEELTLAMIE